MFLMYTTKDKWARERGGACNTVLIPTQCSLRFIFRLFLFLSLNSASFIFEGFTLYNYAQNNSLWVRRISVRVCQIITLKIRYSRLRFDSHIRLTFKESLIKWSDSAKKKLIKLTHLSLPVGLWEYIDMWVFFFWFFFWSFLLQFYRHKET